MKTIQMILAFFVLMLASCGNPPKAEAVTPAKLAQEVVGTQLANPMREVTVEEMEAAAGIRLYAPENAENVRYYTIAAGDIVIGQMDFTLNGRDYTYRTTSAPLDVTELSGMYFIAAAESDAQLSWAAGKIYTQGNSSVLFWEDTTSEVRCSLSSTACEDPNILPEIAEDTFKPRQDREAGLAETSTECLEPKDI